MSMSVQEQEYRFAATCRALQENRSDTTEPNFSFACNPHCSGPEAMTRIGRALRGNTAVTKLAVDMALTGVADGIVQFIAGSPSLYDLTLSGDSTGIVVAEQFLAAAASNGRIGKLCIREECQNLVLPLANCLQAKRTTLVSLHMSFCFRDPENEEVIEDANIVADAVGSLSSLEELSLKNHLDECFIVRIITRLVGHPNIRRLTYLNVSDDQVGVSVAIRDFLLSSTPVEVLYVDLISDESSLTYNEDVVGLADVVDVLAGTHGHTTLRELTLYSRMNGDDCATAFATMLRHNESIEKLAMRCHSLLSLSTVIEALGTNCTLKRLNVYVLKHDESQRLATLLPQMRHLKTLSLFHFSGTAGETIPADFWRGLELNTSLTDVEISWLDDDAKATLAYYTTRNTYRPSLVSASKAEMLTIFESAWVHGNAGLSVVFETLRVRDDWYETVE